MKDAAELIAKFFTINISNLLVVRLLLCLPVQLPEDVRWEDVVVVAGRPLGQLVPPGQLEGQPGHQAGGDVLRYETRRVDTGVQQVASRGGGQDGQWRAGQVRQGLGGEVGVMVDNNSAP